MFKPCLIVYLEDLAFHDQIKKIAKDQKVDLYFAGQGDQLSQLIKTYASFLMLVDLSGLDASWIFRHISIIKNINSNFPVCAIVDEDHENIRSRAEKFGCNQIITKSELIPLLPDMIKQFYRRAM